MNVWLLVLVGLAGGVGATLRWLLDAFITRFAPRVTGIGILVVNATGSFALGVVAGALPQGDLATVLGTGLLGGYTTFSAVAVLSAGLDSPRRALWSAAYTAATFAACVAVAAGGLALGAFLR